MRGDKIGVIGPNGCGKSTFLRALLGKDKPAKGTVRMGTGLEISYFDQLREALDEEKTVIENVCGMSDTVVVNGKPRHIIGYLEDFLFTRDRAKTPVKVLSGGERNRLLLARLFTRPSNVLVMDEPTNDLDIETLELLEQWLVEYSGTLLLVSHDRAFLNNVVTSTMVFENDGEINEYPGGYDDWLAQRAPRPVAVPAAPQVLAKKDKAPAGAPKLSNKENRELFNLPGKIATLEIRMEELGMELSDPELYKKDPAEINRIKSASADLAFQIAEAYKRWDELEQRAAA
jgi:ATP-binding cassette subfamily F protein uup